MTEATPKRHSDTLGRGADSMVTAHDTHPSRRVHTPASGEMPSDAELGYAPPAEVEIMGDPRFHAWLDRLGELHDRKQRDYGNRDDAFANVRAAEIIGIPAWVSGMIRLNDKIIRLRKVEEGAIYEALRARQRTMVHIDGSTEPCSLPNCGPCQPLGRQYQLANEGVIDSLMDIAVYSLIALVLFEEANETKSSSDSTENPQPSQR